MADRAELCLAQGDLDSCQQHCMALLRINSLNERASLMLAGTTDTPGRNGWLRWGYFVDVVSAHMLVLGGNAYRVTFATRKHTHTHTHTHTHARKTDQT